MSQSQLISTNQTLTIQKVIQFLQNLYIKESNLSNETILLDKELALLTLTNTELQKKYHLLEQQYTIIQEDFHTLSSILNRAQHYITKNKVTTTHIPLAPIFEVDQNGQIDIINIQ